MADMTTYLKNKIYDHVFRNMEYTSPPSVWVALFTTATDDAGGGAEVTETGYAREELTAAAPVDGEGGNSVAISFGPATEDWTEVTHVALMDAAVAGNMLLHAALAAPKTVENGETGDFAIDALDLAFL